MESEFVEDSQSTTTYEQLFNEAFPMYLALGMSYDEFYNKDPMLCKAYIKAHDIKMNQTNTELWLQGIYFNDALTKALYNAFKKKSEPIMKYFEKPIDLTPMDDEMKNLKAKKQHEEELAKAKEWMEAQKRRRSVNRA